MPIFGPYSRKELTVRPQYSAASVSVMYGFLWITNPSPSVKVWRLTSNSSYSFSVLLVIHPDPTPKERATKPLKQDRAGTEKCATLMPSPTGNTTSPLGKRVADFIALQFAEWGSGALA